jgi:thioredoxin-dependent peroxiredoxin
MTKTPAFLVLTLGLMLGASPLRAAAIPKVGEPAPNFALRTLDDRSVGLKALTEKSPVVLVVLRGWPGYQCPLCTKQVHEFVAQAAEFKARGAQVLMVYPGPAAQLKAHAEEFLRDKSWPADFLLVVDPDYSFTKAYGLRWEAKGETAYPSTFVIARGGTITFAHVSKSHGDRVSPAGALAALALK